MCKDDLFIYYFIFGLQLARGREYDEALRSFQLAEGCLDESAGNQFYIYGQYMAEFASLYRILGRENEAVQCLNAAIGFYDFQGCRGKVAELKAELVKKPAGLRSAV